MPFGRTGGLAIFSRQKGAAHRWLTVVTVLGVLVLWQVVTAGGMVDPKLVPSPQAVWRAFLDIAQNGYKNHTLLQHIGTSLGRLLLAFVLAALLAVPLGLASGYSSKVRAVLEPLVEFYRPLPPLAYYTVLVLWLGIENKSKVALLLLACFAPIYVACVAAVLRIRQDDMNCAYAVGASRAQAFVHVIFPSCLPDILTGLRTALGVGYTTLVSAEMVAATSGLGWMVLDASRLLRSDIVFLGILIMGITGVLLDRGLRLIEKMLVPWKGKE
ncbi:MAG: taurine transport system permease protein [Clostridiales bacterium]|nr:taurine transport system permease protein [Clostridiales bacterium]